VDCRTAAESGEAPPGAADPDMAGGGLTRLPKSRYETISSYICNCGGGANPLTATSKYNDVAVNYDEAIYKKCLEKGLDDLLARHVAYNFVRDPVVIFEERIELDDEREVDHMENLWSTNWNTVRFKPPPPNTDIGWRTEFRPMEVQLTDFENAAFTVFTVLISRVILAFDLNLYIPISLVDQNMERAHDRNAIRTQKFWWRRHMAPPVMSDCKADRPDCCKIHAEADSYEEMTASEILLGKGKYFPGLLPMIEAYLETIGLDSVTTKTIKSYMSFIQQRASGELLTTATWMRQFVQGHPEYKQASPLPPGGALTLPLPLPLIGGLPALPGDRLRLGPGMQADWRGPQNLPRAVWRLPYLQAPAQGAAVQ
jgi:glutamate--cysteine ligase catalytic subunit